MGSEQAAKKAVEAEPEKFLGYTISGSLVYLCQHGSVMICVDSYTTFLLNCKRRVTCALFEDGLCGDAGTKRFPGGLENGKGGRPWAEWKRPGLGLYDRPGLKLFGSIEPDDIHQGSVGNCSLLASIAALAEFPNALRTLFVSPGSSALAENGEYHVRLWDWGTRDWVLIKIDDRFATSKGAVQAQFAKITEDGEIYPMLLEKAVAVMAKGFDFCNSIMPTWALGVLTGCPAVFEFHLESRAWTGWRPEYDGASTFKHKSSSHQDVWLDGKRGDQPQTCDTMWQAMIAWDEANHLMCCGARASGKTDQNDRNGVLYLHAYSVLQVKPNVAGSGQDLVQLRNPHGAGGREPDLPWKDGHENWGRFPAVADQLDWNEGSWKPDGLFWMSRADFFEYFNTFYLVKCDLTRVGRKAGGPSLCKMGCGRRSAAARDGRRFNTCCKACACGRGHNGCCTAAADGRPEGKAGGDASVMLCKKGCGRHCANGYATCCMACLLGRGHGVRCDRRSGHAAKRTSGEAAQQPLQVGEACMYLSQSLAKWVECRVTACREDGAVELDVKPGAWLTLAEQVQKLRRQKGSTADGGGQPAGAFSPPPRYTAGQQLQYHSVSQAAWIECTIIQVREDGAVQINVKVGHWLTIEEQTQTLRRAPS